MLGNYQLDLRNRLQWNFNQNTKLFIHENASEYILGEMAAILFRLSLVCWQTMLPFLIFPLQWRQNGHDSVSNHQPHDCLLNRLFRRRSKRTSKLRVTGLCVGNSPLKWPVTRKMFPFDDVIMQDFYQEFNSLSCSAMMCRQTSNAMRIKSQNFDVSRLVLQLSLPNLLKSVVKSRMKM